MIPRSALDSVCVIVAVRWRVISWVALGTPSSLRCIRRTAILATLEMARASPSTTRIRTPWLRIHTMDATSTWLAIKPTMGQ